jgi:hypothetical protein
MSGADGSINIDTRVDEDQFDKGIRNMVKKIERLEKQIDRFGMSLRVMGLIATVAFKGTVAIIGRVISGVKNLIKGVIRFGLRLGVALGAGIALGSRLLNSLGYMTDNVKQVKDAFYQLKSAVGNALIPIFNALIPLIMRMVGWFVNLFNIVSMVVSALTGAKTAMVNLGKETAKTGAQAQKALAPFDELQVLNQGGGGDEGGIGLGGTEVPIPEGLLETLERIKDALQPLIDAFRSLWENGLAPLMGFVWDSLQNFYENFLLPIGTWALGEEGLPRLLGIFEGILDDIDWEGINEAMTPLWTVLSDLAILVFNGIIDLMEKFFTPMQDWDGTNAIGTIQTLTEKLERFRDVVSNEEFEATFWEQLATSWNDLIAPLSAVLTAIIMILVILNPIAILILLVIGLVVLLTSKWDELKTTVSQLFELMKLSFVTLLMIASYWATQLVTLLLTPFVMLYVGLVDIFESIKEFIKGWFDMVVGIIGGIATTIASVIVGAGALLYAIFTGKITALKGIAQAIIGGIVGGINQAIEGINSLSVSIPSWVPLIGGFSWSPNLSPIAVPQLATGAVIPPNGQFLAMLGDQTHGKNLEAPEGLIRQIIREEMGGRSQEITINFAGDLAGLVRELKPYIDKEDARIGGSLVSGGIA